MDDFTKNQLDALIGETIHYEKQNITIKRYKEVAGCICIVTDVRTLQFYPEELQEKFIDKINDEKAKDTFNPPSPVKKQFLVAVPDENVTIKDSLLDALKKVKEDPGYLAQAKSICEITNALVNVQKTEIEMIKLSNEL